MRIELNAGDIDVRCPFPHDEVQEEDGWLTYIDRDSSTPRDIQCRSGNYANLQHFLNLVIPAMVRETRKTEARIAELEKVVADLIQTNINPTAALSAILDREEGQK